MLKSKWSLLTGALLFLSSIQSAAEIKEKQMDYKPKKFLNGPQIPMQYRCGETEVEKGTICIEDVIYFCEDGFPANMSKQGEPSCGDSGKEVIKVGCTVGTLSDAKDADGISKLVCEYLAKPQCPFGYSVSISNKGLVCKPQVPKD